MHEHASKRVEPYSSPVLFHAGSTVFAVQLISLLLMNKLPPSLSLRDFQHSATSIHNSDQKWGLHTIILWFFVAFLTENFMATYWYSDERGHHRAWTSGNVPTFPWQFWPYLLPWVRFMSFTSAGISS